MYVMIDNFDSFVYNLSSYFQEFGQEIQVKRCDKVTIEEIEACDPKGLILSPGPGRPGEAEVSREVLKHFAGRVPILGVCLGHQIIGDVFGAEVKKGKRPMHGKVTPVFHRGEGLFSGLPPAFEVTRYHSLVVEREAFPNCLRVDAWDADGTVMAVTHRDLPVYGVQFHPEAVKSEYGHELLKNFHGICAEWRKNHG